MPARVWPRGKGEYDDEYDEMVVTLDKLQDAGRKLYRVAGRSQYRSNAACAINKSGKYTCGKYLSSSFIIRGAEQSPERFL
jgi:hypothetical protein